MPHVTNRNAAIYFEVLGDTSRPAVALVHGRGGNTAIWFQQMPAMLERHCVVVFDHRGFGRSRCAEADYDMAHFASDLAAVLDAAGIARAALVCQSMGGWTGMRMALEYPARVSALVLANTIAGVSTPSAAAAIAATRAQLAAKGIGASALDPAFAEGSPGLAYLYHQISGQNQVTAGDWHSRSAAPTTPEEAASITAPVLMLTAENDTIFPPAAIREIAGLIPGAKFRELSGAGHSAYFEIPQTWNAAVLEFLQALALPGPAPDRRV